ncbi:MAG: LuxR C-terminal-related transcriptional regulator, partial [Oscillospiraceae bacterium]|nr:LuxR C-terminal-related transcriptional regulator [Oscillospiraceae bacterium]
EKMKNQILKAQLPRTALMKQLDGLLPRQAIYIHAPAGFGKTISSLLWAEHRQKAAGALQAWISLDEHDNKPSEFCGRFVRALAELQAENSALNELATHPAFNTEPLEFAFRALGLFAAESGKNTTPEYILTLDDLHDINNEDVLGLLPGLIKRLPRSCTVLLLSRRTPPDSLFAMVQKGEIAVVNAEYLQFTAGEIKIFWGVNGRYLTNKQAEEIFVSTGGWAIGVRAMFLSNEKYYSSEVVGDYFERFLTEHVWERWDERHKRFMLLVSVAEELTPELCERLIADDKQLKKTNVAEILHELVQENTFLRETDRNTYFFHDLFRDFLMKMLQKQYEQIMTAQYDRTGDYYFSKKDYFRAIDYYLKSKNDDAVAKSLYQMYNYNSESASIEDTLYIIKRAVNDALLGKHPFLLETLAWAAFAEGHPDDFESLLDKYYKAFPKIVIKNPRSTINYMMFNVVDYRKPLVPLMKTLGRIPLKGIVNIRAYTPSITNNQPFFHRSVRDFSEFADDLDKGITLFEKAFGDVIGAEFPVIKECLYAGIYYERSNLDKATLHAMAACSNIPADCSAEIKFCAMMILAAVIFAETPDSGLQNSELDKVLENVKGMIEHDKAYFLSPHLQAFICEIKLSDGDKQAANEWLKSCNENIYDSLSMFKSYRYFTTARAYITVGNYNQAILLLQKLLKLSERYKRVIDIIETCILLAIAYWRKPGTGQSAAMDYLSRAAVVAEEYGYTQMFINQGADLVSMLHKMQKRVIQKTYDPAEGQPSGKFVKSLYILALARSKKSKGFTGGRLQENLTFTEKQTTVMRLMCEGYSRNEIASHMGLTPDGAKAHIGLVYRKLDVSTAVEAIFRIRELGLLGEG